MVGVATTWGTVLKGSTSRKVENRSPGRPGGSLATCLAFYVIYSASLSLMGLKSSRPDPERESHDHEGQGEGPLTSPPLSTNLSGSPPLSAPPTACGGTQIWQPHCYFPLSPGLSFQQGPQQAGHKFPTTPKSPISKAMQMLSGSQSSPRRETRLPLTFGKFTFSK